VEKLPEIQCFHLDNKGFFNDPQNAHGKILEYIFNESGSYSFNIKGYPQMEMTITVK